MAQAKRMPLARVKDFCFIGVASLVFYTNHCNGCGSLCKQGFGEGVRCRSFHQIWQKEIGQFNDFSKKLKNSLNIYIYIYILIVAKNAFSQIIYIMQEEWKWEKRLIASSTISERM